MAASSGAASTGCVHMDGVRLQFLVVCPYSAAGYSCRIWGKLVYSCHWFPCLPSGDSNIFFLLPKCGAAKPRHCQHSFIFYFWGMPWMGRRGQAFSKGCYAKAPDRDVHGAYV